MDIQTIRSRFPGLDGGTTLLENAGGSQVPESVADAIRNHLLHDYCQLGAGYPASDRATETVELAHRFMDRYVNGEGIGRVALGSSCTTLMHVLATAVGRTLRPGDEIVVCEQGHEANIGCWLDLERLGARIRWWKVDSETGSLHLDDLAAVLSDRTRIVAFPHASNLLGEIVDVPAATRMVHDAGGRVVVDGVAFAPHRAIDVRAWNVDFYAWSTYKVYGPHMGALFGRTDAFQELRGPNHFFIDEEDIPYKYELGGASHEGCAGLCALAGYLGDLCDESGTNAGNCGHDLVRRAFDRMTRLEEPVQARLLERLVAHQGVRIVGPESWNVEDRVATVSMIHARRSPLEVVSAAHAGGFGIRNGHMYAHRLCTALEIDPEPGVVRISAVHYNTVEEVDGLMDVLDPLLASTAT
ncbi:MAG: cysteine desulfurase-like protein [Phycisphaera sp.]|nr:cysteine desulfurase-like protein [Phycisphaera sp.]